MNWIFRTDKFLLYFLPFLMACGSQALVNQVQHNASLKKILLTPSAGAVKLEISYDSGCSIKQLWVSWEQCAGTGWRFYRYCYFNRNRQFATIDAGPPGNCNGQ
ncbi:MAG: hypothetical protein A1D16_12975 [Flavihumibacter sp. CACIAM 22H1]|nr:MAG: hypothetical protein A1D16_12975 [Flavihumibacter sp. CACIAM 22H1]